MSLVLALALAAPTAAQGLDATGVPVVVEDGDLQDFMLLFRPEPQTPGNLGLSVGYSFIEAPYWPVETGVGDPLLDTVNELDLSVFYGLHERVGLGLNLPFIPNSWSDTAPLEPGATTHNPMAFGDARIMAPIGIIVPDFNSGGFGLTAAPYLGLPTGATDLYLGDGGLSGGLALAPAYSWLGLAQITGQIGIGFQPTRDNMIDRPGGTHLVGGVGAGVELHRTLAARGEFAFEVPFDTGEAPGVFLATLRGRYRNGFTWTGGGGLDLGNFGVNSARLMFQVGWVTTRPMDRDIDLDGIVDADDDCRFKEEVVNQYRDGDGCPDELAALDLRVMDLEGNPVKAAKVGINAVSEKTDADGWVKVVDFIPETEPTIVIDAMGYKPQMIRELLLQPGPNNKVITLDWKAVDLKVRTHAADSGLPVDTALKIEGPGNVDSQSTGRGGQVSIPLRPGTWKLTAYADFFEEQHFELNLEPGAGEQALDLQLKRTGVILSKEEVINQVKIYFPPGSDEFDPAWKPFLDDLAQTLLVYPYVDVEIHGHLDASEEGQKLDRLRAEATKAYLESQKIDSDRLTIKTFGSSKPVTDERAKDWGAARVDFHMVPLKDLVVSDVVRFAEGSADLDAAGDAAVSSVASVLKRDEHWRLEVHGHADASEGEKLVNLTARRAETVRRKLIALGVPEHRLIVKAKGGTEKASTLPAANRRVSFQAYSGDDIMIEVPFDSGQSTFSETGAELVEAVANRLVAADHLRIEVHGHRADGEETAVSKARGEAVKAALVEHGIKSTRLLRLDRGYEKAGSKAAFSIRVTPAMPHVIGFEAESSGLGEAQGETLDALARRLKAWGVYVDVIAYTHASDGETALMPEGEADDAELAEGAEAGLARARAQAVVQALSERGVSAKRLRIKTVYVDAPEDGAEPVEVDPDAEASMFGRRVEIRVR